MDIIPAVDIMKGRIVRLLKGDPKFIKSYQHLGDPISLALRWESEGAPIIHIVDLDAALGFGNNLEVINTIIKKTNVPVQVGGGIRSLDTAWQLFSNGVRRIILGSLAFKNPLAIKSLLKEFGEERIVVALDNLGGMVMIHGWKSPSGKNISEAVERFTHLNVKFFLVTSVARDGSLSGPDLETLSEICNRKIKIIAAGGIRSLEDLVVLSDLGLNGVVVGKALYEGIFSLREALRTVRKI